MKKLIKPIALALVVVFVVGILISILFPAKETVYVLTEMRYVSTYRDSNDVQYECEIEYDKYGNPSHNPTLDFRRNSLNWIGMVTNDFDPPEMKYDTHGNITYLGEHYHEFEYTYDLFGRIETCTEYDYDGELYATWNYTWNLRGQLVQVISDLEQGMDQVVRADFEYDRKGRLIKEYFFYIGDESFFEDLREEGYIDICALEYQYDRNGNLESVSSGWSKGHDRFDMKLNELDIEVYEAYRMEYDDGQLTAMEYAAADPVFLDQSDYENDIEWSEREFEYDRKGNLQPTIDDYPDEFEYDKHGNLTKITTNHDSYWEFEYEEVQMTRKAAQKYYRWERLLYMDIDSLHLGIHNVSLTARHPSIYSVFVMHFFYLYVPNPLW